MAVKVNCLQGANVTVWVYNLGHILNGAMLQFKGPLFRWFPVQTARCSEARVLKVQWSEGWMFLYMLWCWEYECHKYCWIRSAYIYLSLHYVWLQNGLYQNICQSFFKTSLKSFWVEKYIVSWERNVAYAKVKLDYEVGRRTARHH